MNESLHALSGAYVVDALDDDERRIFEEHLPTCVDCRREVAELREAAVLMADDAALTPPASLRTSVLTGITTIRPLAPETGAKVVAFRPRRRRVTQLLVAAAAVLVVAGGAIYQPWQVDSGTPSATLEPADRVLAASDAKHYSLDFADGSTATVVRSVSEGRAVLLTRDMAAPPPGKAFEIWLQDDQGAMIPAGMMKTEGDHKVLLEGDAVKATGVGITVEPESGSEAPTSEPIALFELEKAEA